jgi:hypothetical protein
MREQILVNAHQPRRRRLSAAVPALAAAALLLGGCGGGESSTTASSAASAANGSTAASNGATSTGASTARASTAGSGAPAATTTAPAGASSTTPSTAATTTTPRTTKAVRVSGMPGTTITHFGSAAASGDQAAVTKLVKSYYAALAADRGGAACALLGARIRSAIEHSIGRTPLAHGHGCEGVVTIVFRHHPGQKSTVSQSVTVTGVRVSGDRGYALISTPQRPSEEIRIEREHGAWKVGALIGSPLAP